MSRLRRRLVVLLVPSLLLSLPAVSARAGVPSRLELLPTRSSVTLDKYGTQPVYLELGVYVAAREAPFEIRIARPTYDDPVRAWQYGSAGRIREVPMELLDSWYGLRGFVRIDVFNEAGKFVARRLVNWCPNGWDAQRVDDTGPFDPTYPVGCWANPFTLGMVWGVDQGWGVSASGFDGTAAVRLRAGTYRAHVTIPPAFRDLFKIHRSDASVWIDVRVRKVSDPCSRGCEGQTTASVREGAQRTSLTPARTVRTPGPAAMPDLIPLPSYGIFTSHERGRDYLDFGANVWNRGPSPLVVEGFRLAGQDEMDAFQYFFRDGELVGRAPVGSFEFDRRRGHQHWHFEQFATYRLLDATGGVVVLSHKQAFCLAPTDPIDLTVPSATWRESLGFSQCGYESSLWIRETLPTGWGDTYFQGIPGQSFDITDLPNGTYVIEVTANPLGLLFESDPSNDVSLRTVILRGTPGHRRVRVPPYHGIDTEGSFFG